MKFKTIQSQIIVTFVSIIIGIQLIGLIPIGRSINQNAYQSAENDLKVGTSVFNNILEQNTANLTQGAKILAADYGFKSSVTSEDSETINSAPAITKRVLMRILLFFPLSVQITSSSLATCLRPQQLRSQMN